ncbi:MAG: SLC13 family permease [Clostridia bacterium]|jgi:sodium-dependent dicarboxylate transporter 2/3/5|nr:SLC13 family permease [Spirochaetia bacterium]
MKKSPSTTRRIFLFGIGVAALIVILALPLPGEAPTGAVLDEKGRRALAGLAFALILWIGEVLPFHLTGILAMGVLAILGSSSWSELVKTGFGDESTVFFIGVLALAAALGRSGLAARMGRKVLALTGDSTRAIVFGFLVAGASLAMWVTALAAAALMLPLAAGLLKGEGDEPGTGGFGRSLMMAVAWGPLIGALGAPSGSGSNPVVVRFLFELAGLELGFLDWMAFGVPIMVLLLPAAWFVIISIFPPDRRRLHGAQKKAVHTPQPLSRDEKAAAVVFLSVVALWLGSPLLKQILGWSPSIGMVAALGAVALFLPGIGGFKWKDLEKDMDWAGVLLIATGIALGTALYKSGAAGWVAGVAFGSIGTLPNFWRLVAVVLGVLAVKVVFSSNTLTGTIIVPLVLSLGPALGIDVRLAALGAGLTANLAVILVTTSPVNVLPWSTGYFSIKDMAIAGLAFAPVAALVIAAVLSIVGGCYGLL